MSETSNPFAGPEERAHPAARGMIVAWSVAGVALVAAVVFLVLWAQNRANSQYDLKTLRAKLNKATGDLAAAEASIQTSQDLILSLTNQVNELQQAKEMAGHVARSLEDEMREQLESRDVTISKLQGKLTVTIVDRVMFDSGEDVLKPDGAAVMQKIAGLLASHSELKIHVIGHTDNVPIRPSAHNRFTSNWELSAARALAAVHYLVDKAGVDPRRLGAVGYGEFRPIADNATPEGRAKNRRIAITILADELAGVDTLTDVSDPGSTNSVPEIENGVPLR